MGASKTWKRAADREAYSCPWVRPGELQYLEFPERVALVNGAFDILHAGHMRLIWTACEYSDLVIVALDSDEKISAEKGPSRPILTFAERATALNFMPVSLIVPITTQADMDAVVAVATLRVQSDEYLGKPSRYPATPKIFVRDTPLHSSSIITRIQKGLNAPNH